jgi:hypothetical protein
VIFSEIRVSGIFFDYFPEIIAIYKEKKNVILQFYDRSHLVHMMTVHFVVIDLREKISITTISTRKKIDKAFGSREHT